MKLVRMYFVTWTIDPADVYIKMLDLNFGSNGAKDSF